MPSVRGCNLPDDLLYDVDNHIWFRETGDGTPMRGDFHVLDLGAIDEGMANL